MVAARGCPLVLVSIDDDGHALQSYLTQHQIAEAVASGVTNKLVGFERGRGIPQYAVVQGGYIYWCQFDFPDEASGLADLDWFLGQQDLHRFMHAE
jgi:hypothetical protein